MIRHIPQGCMVNVECEALKEEKRLTGEVVIGSPNHLAIAVAFDHHIAIGDGQGGMMISNCVALGQHLDGSFTDTLGNPWKVEIVP